MKDIKIEAGKIYVLTKTNAKQGTVEEFKARVDCIEDRGDKWYIGYTPIYGRHIYRNGGCRNHGKFGSLSVKKEGSFAAINYGFRAIED